MAGEAGLKPVAKGRRSPGRHRTDSSPVLVRARKSVAESLFRNSAFLVINLIVGACCGYGAFSRLNAPYPQQAPTIRLITRKAEFRKRLSATDFRALTRTGELSVRCRPGERRPLATGLRPASPAITGMLSNQKDPPRKSFPSANKNG